MKSLTFLFIGLIVLIQYPLWFGENSGWLNVWHLQHAIDAQNTINNHLKLRNEALEADVRELKSNDLAAAIEERARSQLGMIKEDEVFYQVMQNE